jgi:Zn finger protein HypA/HybF involved in hydrogenase expression
MAVSISIEEIDLRAYDNNKTIICEVEKRRTDRYFKTKCNLCGMEKEQRINLFSKCKGCMINKLSKDTPWFIEQSREVHGNKYDYSGSFYKNCRIPLEIKCNDCNTVFYQRPYSHLYGHGCPNCRESKGELYLKKILRENNIEFIPQHPFPGLRNINPLKCDVYVPIVNLVIEVDGDGHRNAIYGYTPEDKQKNLENTIRNDAIKDKYFEEHKINICRIPYSTSDKDLSFIGEIAMNCYNDLRIKYNINMLDFNNEENVDVL